MRRLLLLVASDQITQVLAGVSVLTRPDASVDVVTQRLRKRKAHRVPTHGASMPQLSTVVNIVACPAAAAAAARGSVCDPQRGGYRSGLRKRLLRSSTCSTGFGSVAMS